MIGHLIFVAGLCSVVFTLLPIAEEVRSRFRLPPRLAQAMPVLTFALMIVLGSILGHRLTPDIVLSGHGPAIAAATIGFGPVVGFVTALVAAVARSLTGEPLERIIAVLVDFALVVFLMRFRPVRPAGPWKSLVFLNAVGLAIGVTASLAVHLGNQRLSPIDATTVNPLFEVFLSRWFGTVLLIYLVGLHLRHQRSLAFLRGAVSTSLDGYAQTDGDGVLVEVNPALEAISGYPRAELLGRHLADLRAEADRSEIAGQIGDIRRQGHVRYESRWRRKDGTERVLEVSAAAAPAEFGGIYAFVRDVTEARAAEAKLRRQEARFRLALEAAGMVSWELEPQTGGIRYSDNLAAMSGNEDISPFIELDRFLAQVHPDDRARIGSAVRRTLDTNAPFNCDYRVQLQDGTWRWLLGKGRFVAATQDAPRQILGVAVDITERRAAEEQARRWQQMFEHADFGLATVDTTTNTFLEVNPAFARQRGFTPAELAGRPTTDVVAPEAHLGTAPRRHSVDDEGHLVFESIHRRKDGSRFPVLMEVTSIRDAAGRPVARVACAVDITERKEAEARLRQWADAFEHCAHGIVLGDPNSFSVIACNPAMARLLQRSAVEVSGSPVPSLYAPECHAQLPQWVAEADRVGHVRYEAVMVRGDGSKFPVQMDLVTVRGEDGRARYRVATAQDITERQRAEQALRASESRFSLAVTGARIGVWEQDLSTGHLDWSPQAIRLWGYQPGEFSGRYEDFISRVHPDDRAEMAAIGERSRRDRTPWEYEFRVIWADGSIHWISSRGHFLFDESGQPLRLTGVVLDIDARRRAEGALREERQRLALIIEGTEVGTWDWDLATDAVAINERFAAILGYPPGEQASLAANAWSASIHPDDLPGAKATLERHFRRELPSFESEVRRRRPDGRWVWTLDRGRVAEWAPDGRPLRILGISMDITERKRTEEALRRSEERFRGALDSMIEGCQIIGFDWRYRYVNAAAARSGRTTVEALEGRTMMECYPGIDGTPLFPQLRACMESRVSRHLENEFRHADGTRAWFELVIHPIPEGIFILSLDITERKRSEESLRESELRYRLVTETSTDVIWLYDLTSERFTYVSPSVEKLRGFTPAEIYQQRMPEVMTAESFSLVRRRLEARLKAYTAGDDSVRTQTHEIDQVRRDGSIVPTEVVTTLIADSGRRVTHLQGVTRDISERRRADAALRESLFFRREAEKIARIGAWKVNPATDYLYWTEGVHEIVEVPIEERMGLVEGMGFYDAEAIPVLRAALERALADGSSFVIEAGLTTRSGRHLWTEIRGLGRVEEGGQAFVMGTFQDITARREAERALRRGEERLRLAIEASGEGLYDIHLPTGEVVVNDQYAIMLGYPPSEFHESIDGWAGRLHPEDTEAAVSAFADYLAGSRPSYEQEFRLRTRSGAWIWVRSLGRIMSRDAAGRPLRMLGTHIDVTPRREAEERTRQLRDLGLDVARTSDLAAALQLCLRTALAIAGTDAGGIYLVDPRDGFLELQSHAGLSPEFAAEVRRYPPDSPNARWARLGEVFYGHARDLGLLESPVDRREDLKALALLPITSEGELIALLNIASHRLEEIPAAARTALETVTSVITSAILRDRAHEALARANAELESRVETRTRALARSEERFRLLFEMSPFPMGLTNPRGEITFLNQRFLQTFGYSHEEIPTLDDWWLRAYPDPEYRRQIIQGWQGSLTLPPSPTPEVKTREVRITCADGRVRNLLVSSILLGDESLATFVDVTGLREADARLRKLEGAVEQSPVAVVITDSTARIEYVNPSFSTQTGYTREEAMGKNPRFLKSGIHPPQFYEQLWGTLRSGGTWRGEFCNRHKNGSLIWESTSIAPIRDAEGRTTHFVAIKEDITQRRRISEELRKAKENAEAANLAKSRFLANMSHEIRTPMNAILGFAQLLQRESGLNERQRHHLDTINRSGEHLLGLINDILDMSKIEAGRLQVSPDACDFHALLDDLASLFRLRAEEKNLRFEVVRRPDVPARLRTDTRRVRQVLINLLGNAVKFTDRGQVVLHVSVAPPEPGTDDCLLALDVTDSGPGIAAEELASLFAPFAQAATGQHHGGSGLGLAISRQLARLLGGDVTAVSQPGIGSTFRFTFLAAALDSPTLSDPGHGPKIPLPRRLPPGRPTPSILVVDDIASNRDLLRAVLEKVGYRVFETSSGAEAITVCHDLRPDLVLMDRRMPAMDGLEATRAIRSQPGGTDLKLVIVSAGVLGTDDEEWRGSGADAFVGKPVREEDLLTTIGRLLQLEYVDAAPTSPAEPEASEGSTNAIESVRRLSASVRAEMIDATESGDVSRLRDLVAREVAPQDRALAHTLSRAIAQFDYVTILGLLRSPSHE